MKLTDYQKAQLLHKHMTGEFKYRNAKGHKVARSAWTKMIDALVDNGLIDGYNAQVTEKGHKFCDQNHTMISLAVLS
jgi:hypothetical protein